MSDKPNQSDGSSSGSNNPPPKNPPPPPPPQKLPEPPQVTTYTDTYKKNFDPDKPSEK